MEAAPTGPASSAHAGGWGRPVTWPLALGPLVLASSLIPSRTWRPPRGWRLLYRPSSPTANPSKKMTPRIMPGLMSRFPDHEALWRHQGTRDRARPRRHRRRDDHPAGLRDVRACRV